MLAFMGRAADEQFQPHDCLFLAQGESWVPVPGLVVGY